jgi:hypothetical protein
MGRPRQYQNGVLGDLQRNGAHLRVGRKTPKKWRVFSIEKLPSQASQIGEGPPKRDMIHHSRLKLLQEIPEGVMFDEMVR